MRTFRRLALVAVGLVALIGVLHVPALRGVMRSLAGCPFPTSGRTLSPAEAEALRVHTFGRDGAGLASGMPALGFTLGRDDRVSIFGWAARHGVACANDRHGASLRCADVPARALGLPADGKGVLGLGFDVQGKLVSVQFALVERSRPVAVAIAEQAEAELAQAGRPSLRRSELNGPLAQRRALVALADYRAEVSTTHLGGHFAIEQSYQRFTR